VSEIPVDEAFLSLRACTAVGPEQAARLPPRRAAVLAWSGSARLPLDGIRHQTLGEPYR